VDNELNGPEKIKGFIRKRERGFLRPLAFLELKFPFVAGLPDNIKYQIWVSFLEGLALEDTDNFYGHFGLFSSHLVYFMVLYIYCGPRLGKLYHEKSGNPALWPLKRKHPRVLCNTTAHAQLTCCGIYCTIFPP
jgi:hypothetical protein